MGTTYAVASDRTTCTNRDAESEAVPVEGGGTGGERGNMPSMAFVAKQGTAAADGKGRNSPYNTVPLAHLEGSGLEVVLMFRSAGMRRWR